MTSERLLEPTREGIAIPSALMERCHLHPNDRVLIEERGNGMLITKQESQPEATAHDAIERLLQALRKLGGTQTDVVESMHRERAAEDAHWL